MERVIQRGAEVRTMNDDMVAKRQVEFVISSEAVDSYGTVFRMDGWDLNRYIKNPIVCYQHRSHSNDPDDIIGTSEVFVDGEQLIGRVTFEPKEVNEKAEKIFQKVLNGTLKMASVGASVKKARLGEEEKGEDPKVLYFLRQELMEWSVVSAGANPDAHKRNEQSLEEVRNELEKKNKKEVQEVGQTCVRGAQLLINKNQ